MSNPYQSPAFDPKQFQDQPAYMPQPQTGFGWVSQVRIVAILNCVQGGLECAMGLMVMSMAGVISYFVRMEKDNPNGPPGGPPPEMEWIFPIVYLVIGSLVLLAGILRIYAGVQNYRFRDRILGIVSLVLGLVSFIGCYCGPTGIAVLVYGLIIYLNPAVVAAFEMGKSGLKGDAILGSFAPQRPMPMQPGPLEPPPPPQAQ